MQNRMKNQQNFRWKKCAPCCVDLYEKVYADVNNAKKLKGNATTTLLYHACNVHMENENKLRLIST